MITSMTVITLYHFVSAHLAAIRGSTDLEEERAALKAVVQYLRAQLRALPAGEDGPLVGQALKFRGLSADEITWRTPGGAGVLTTAAPGYYMVTLAVQPVTGSSTETELGLRRRAIEGNSTSITTGQGGAGGRYNWLPLLRPMAAVEVRYFDAKSHAWTDGWSDPINRPPLVRLRLWRHPNDTPVEAIIDIPASHLVQ